tara:strand:- start:1600 stop:1827 length:228 start_codon:yes stop_codon:yes gene_type:complete
MKKGYDTEVTAKELLFLDDMWTKLFAFHIGTACPNKRAKRKFIHFCLAERVNQETLTEEFVFKQLPSFINYLAEI